MKEYGWVIQDEGDGEFVDENFNAGDLDLAEVFNTRRQARESGIKLKSDVIRKVELDEYGVAVEVISGR